MVDKRLIKWQKGILNKKKTTYKSKKKKGQNELKPPLLSRLLFYFFSIFNYAAERGASPFFVFKGKGQLKWEALQNNKNKAEEEEAGIQIEGTL